MIVMGLFGLGAMAFAASQWVKALTLPRVGYRSVSSGLIWFLIAAAVFPATALFFGFDLSLWVLTLAFLVANWLLTLSVRSFLGAVSRERVAVSMPERNLRDHAVSSRATPIHYPSSSRARTVRRRDDAGHVQVIWPMSSDSSSSSSGSCDSGSSGDGGGGCGGD